MKIFKNEQEIVACFKAGQEDAFHRLYEKYAPVLRYFAAKYLSDSAAIDDVVQDAFVDLWEKRRDFGTETGIRSWLYKAVRNACLNVLRHRQVQEKFFVQEQLQEHSESFLERVFEAEVFEMLLSAFNELSPACRSVYKMSLEGMKHEEIARELNISVNTVKKHKNNANHFLQNRLKDIIICFFCALKWSERSKTD